MSWSIGFDSKWKRDIGYGVPATCDQPGCSEEIDRGLAHVCGGEPYGGDRGCGLYFCSAHLYPIVCDRCLAGAEPYAAKPDVLEWISWKLTDDSWGKWREDNPEKVLQMQSERERACKP